ncbi:hypothetical protein BH09PLA1_BH09PLA1_26950 [soil metagenome]
MIRSSLKIESVLREWNEFAAKNKACIGGARRGKLLGFTEQFMATMLATAVLADGQRMVREC